MSYLDRVRACNAGDLGRYLPFRVAGRRVGWVLPQFAARLANFGDVFHRDDEGVAVAPDLPTPEARTAAVEPALRALSAEGCFATGWRDEPYAVNVAFAEPPLMTMDRSAVPRFGVRAYGIHVNGLVHRDGDILMWVARRSQDRAMSPGKLDQIVAGGQPAGLSLEDNLVKESAEEAGIPAALARRAVPVGAITYIGERLEGLRNDVLFNYDLELPRDFVPVNTDGEAESFRLMPIDEVAALVGDTEEFKFNCAVVAIDFLIRHGRIRPDHPDYVELLRSMHR